jgi:hypothetical protein
MEIRDRIKEIRQAKGLTQQEFADVLKVSRNNIAGYETGRTDPSASAISLICKTFSVSEVWLRTGEGEMFSENSREEQISAFMGDTLAAEPEDFKKRFVSMLASLNLEEWKLLEKIAKELVEKDQEKRRD